MEKLNKMFKLLHVKSQNIGHSNHVVFWHRSPSSRKWLNTVAATGVYSVTRLSFIQVEYNESLTA